MSDGNLIEVLSPVIPLNEVPYSFDDNGLTVHITASYLENVDVKTLVFVGFDQDLFSIPMEKQPKIRDLLYNSGREGVMQAFELMDAMEVSYGEMLSIFQLPPIFSSWEMLLELVQKSYQDANDSSGVHYVALWILSYLTSKGEEWALETTVLYLGGSNLVTLPEKIRFLKNLQELYLNGNQLAYVPEGIGSLPLRILNLNDNQLNSIPSSLSQCPLEELYLDDTTLDHFPSVICNISTLKTLSIQNNSISKIPSTIRKLQNLESVDFYNNDIIVVPQQLGLLSNINSIDLRENPIQKPPRSFHRDCIGPICQTHLI